VRAMKPPGLLRTASMLVACAALMACDRTHTPTPASDDAATPSASGSATPKAPSPGDAPKLSAEALLAPGPEAKRLAKLVGTWDVTATMRPTPDAVPIVVDGLVAERSMMGLYLHEEMKPAPGSKVPAFQRVDYLTFDPVQARWAYVSLDTRAAIGILFARSYEAPAAAAAAAPGPITVFFDTFANPGVGPDVGFAARARHVDEMDGEDHQFKRQYWTKPGVAEWMAIQYEYKRKR
jgi:hypothetical protein